MNYKGLQFRNESSETVEIDIEGHIGWDWWAGQPDKNTKEKLKAELKKIAELQAETIIVNINSYGGDVNHGISIHDLLAEHNAKVITKVNGMTASIATVIAMAGEERKMSDNALFLVHNARSFGWGDKNDIKTLVEDLETVDERIANVYVKATGKEKQEVLDLMDQDKGRGKWLTSDEAKELGFITDVFEPTKAVALHTPANFDNYNLPPLPDGFKEAPDNKESEQTIIDRVFDKVKNFLNQNNQTKTEMKDLQKIIDALKIENKEASIDDVIKAINDLTEERDTLKNDLQTATQEKETAVNALDAVVTDLNAIDETVETAEGNDKKVDAVTNLVAYLRKNAGASTATAHQESDDTPKPGAVSKGDDFEEDLNAVAEEYGFE